MADSEVNVPHGLFAKHRPLTTISFEMQLDNMYHWIEKWNSHERCKMIDLLLPRCELEQVKLLWTVLEPMYHRDFMYSSLNAFPFGTFYAVSTPLSREVHKKLDKPWRKGNRLHRLESAVLHNEEEVRAWTAGSVLPTVKSPLPPPMSPSRKTHKPLFSRNDNRTALHSQLSPSRRFTPPEQTSRFQSLSFCRSAPPILSSAPLNQQALRRHIQNDLKYLSMNDGEESGLVTSRSNSMLSSIVRNQDHNRTGSANRVRFALSKENGFDNRKNLRKSHSCNDVTKISKRVSFGQIHNHSSSDSVQLSSSVGLPEYGLDVMTWFINHWNDWQRNEFLRMFVRLLEPRQMFYMSGLLVVKQYRDFIADLPERLALQILSYLKPKELIVAGKVSSIWRRLTCRNELWEAKCQETYIGVPLDVSSVWKDVYQANQSLNKNWVHGKCRILEMTGHNDHILCVRALDNRIASGSLDRTIRLWDAESGALLQTLEGHTKGVWGIRFLSEIVLISCSYDKTIRIWNLRTGACVRVLTGHEKAVWAIERKGDMLISGSKDKTARLWNIRQCKFLRKLEGHVASIFCVDLDDSAIKAFTGSADRTVRIWDTATGVCLKIIIVGTPGISVTSLSYQQGYLATAVDRKILVYHIQSGECVKKIRAHSERIESLQMKLKVVHGRIDGGIIVSAGKDCKIRYWDFERARCLRTLKGHDDSVNSIHLEDTRIISGGYDNLVKTWDFFNQPDDRDDESST